MMTSTCSLEAGTLDRSLDGVRTELVASKTDSSPAWTHRGAGDGNDDDGSDMMLSF